MNESYFRSASTQGKAGPIDTKAAIAGLRAEETMIFRAFASILGVDVESEEEEMAEREQPPKQPDAHQLPADEWAKHFAAWLGRPEADATVSKTLAALLAAVIAAHGQVSLTREQVIQNAHRPIQLRRTKQHVILFLGEPEEDKS